MANKMSENRQVLSSSVPTPWLLIVTIFLTGYYTDVQKVKEK